MSTLSPKARVVLGFLQDFQAEHGYPPTMREIGAGCGIRSTRSVSDYLKSLEKAGRIRRQGARSRGIELLVDVPENPDRVPVLGAIAAGAPLAADPVYDGSLSLNARQVFGAQDCFALKVKGDSMVDRHIVEGDLAVIQPRAEARDGEVVAVEVGGEVTLKVFRKEGGRLLLMPANSAYAPIVLDEHSGPVRLLGAMVGLVRSA